MILSMYLPTEASNQEIAMLIAAVIFLIFVITRRFLNRGKKG